MQVTFKLFATLMPYLPSDAVRNLVQLKLASGTTINQLIAQYNLPAEQIHLVLLNGKFKAEEERNEALKDGDTLAIWPPVAGG